MKKPHPLHSGVRPGDIPPLRYAVIALLLLFFFLLTLEARALSHTADEPAYVAGGYALLAQGAEALDLLSQRGYPPLMPLLDGVLPYVVEPGLAVSDMEGWPDAFDILAQSLSEAFAPCNCIVFVSRLPTICLTLLLAALVVRWANDLFGRPAGVMALALLVFDPTLLAHGCLATSDAGVTAFGTAALYAAWRWTRSGKWASSTAVGVLLGATLLSKISGPIWLGCAALLMLAGIVRQRPSGLWRNLLQAGSAVTLSLLILWAGYRFQWGPMGDTGPSVPAPAYWKSASYLTDYVSVFYALGQRFYEAQWWYFPLAFTIKNPLPLLLAWLSATASLAVRRKTRRRLGELLLFPVTYGGIALFVGMNLGYRHILPIHPLLHIAAGGGLALWWRSRRLVGRLGIVLLLFWCVAVALRVFPNEIAFFSSLIGGSDEGYRYLVDSNLDWGQRADVVSTVLAENPGVHNGPPGTKLRAAPGRYVIGASELQGVGIGDPYAFEWFRHWTPTETLNYSLVVFDVPPISLKWVAQCGDPLLALDEAALEEGLGISDLRMVGFDCRQAWLYPDGGTTDGIYVIGFGLLGEGHCLFPSTWCSGPTVPDAFLGRRLASSRFSYLDRRSDSPFALYEATPGSLPGGDPGPGRDDFPMVDPDSWAPIALQTSMPDPDDRIFPVPGELLPGDLEGRHSCWLGEPERRPRCTLDGPLAFSGVTVARDGDAIDVETWWRVTEAPITRNFSIAAHLLTLEGELLGNADGLGVWPVELQMGDIFVQRHRFAVSHTSSALWLRTGAYWLDTAKRWSTGADADSFLVRLQVP